MILTTTLTISAIATAVIAAPAAVADAGTDYGNTHAAAVCSELGAQPTLDGVNSVAEQLSTQDGLSLYQAGEAVGTAVFAQCKQYVPLITAYAHHGSELV